MCVCVRAEYWEKCYRKNPDHFREFSHPKDFADDELDGRANATPKKQKTHDADVFDTEIAWVINMMPREEDETEDRRVMYKVKLVPMKMTIIEVSCEFVEA